ncbi:ribose-phosphate diphosphokinase [Dyella sp. RRB7]|uniref:ribose-phosphate diphosphokinase n=1 Tax=Dyella sp. RRB7 TaxID=2919502 RepID=UPI001FA9974E|nr:ribose-phosphate diphosphokinase [Dyella sp. RRB7]
MSYAVYAMPGNEAFADQIAIHGSWPRRALSLHRFPDDEALITLAEPEDKGEALLVCTLDRPDPKIFPLLQAADTLRELGASRVGLVAPYLAYMRQDARFHPGEAVSSRILGKLLTPYFDWVLAADPHLHRHATLAEAGLAHGHTLHVAPTIADWILTNVVRPLIIGPDEESAQWAGEIATLVDAPLIVASKVRKDDRHVSVNLPIPHAAQFANHTPVLVDDIISSGHTMAENAAQLRLLNLPPSICIAVHGIFEAGARQLILNAGASRIVTTNSIVQENGVIDITHLVAQAIAGF